MMYYEQNGKKYGVLNDFDLAAIMTVGERTPKKEGFERTGTLPFMAIDLLRYPDGRYHVGSDTIWKRVCGAWYGKH